MPNDIAHFAIHADDCQRAKAFYEKVFGWTFEPWGPPNFWRIELREARHHLRSRRLTSPPTRVAGLFGPAPVRHPVEAESPRLR